jgi:ATP-dependent RNA helicase DHX29
MAKKKKTKIQPVTRGFATVSTPKKIEEEPVAPAVVREPTDTREGAADNTLPENTSRPASQDGPFADTDKTEEKQLQNLVDRLQDRVEKEIVRTIKVLVYFSADGSLECAHPRQRP